MASLDETPTPPEAPPEAVKPRFGKKLYLVIGLVAIVIIATASIIVFTQFIPGARGEAVSLGFDYSVGEKMTYDLTITMEAIGMDISEEATLEMEIESFDGENYIIHQTITTDSEESSFTVKMNQTGHIIEYIGLPPEVEQTFSSLTGVPGFGSYFTEEEVRVGENWKIPVNMSIMGIDLEGTIKYKLSEITSVTVPAGTYEALKIDIKPSVLRVSYSIEGMDAQVTVNIDGYIYLEKDTCCLIEFRIDESLTVTANGQTQSMEMTMQMQLTEHVK